MLLLTSLELAATDIITAPEAWCDTCRKLELQPRDKEGEESQPDE